MWQIFLMVTGLAFLLGASYTDLKKREVPDWLNYGLIFSGLGLRLMFSFENGFSIFLNGLLGFGVCFGLAYLFYWANWWGGGDSKLLMGMGAVIGFGFNFENWSFSSSDLLLFFIGLLVFGMVMGLVWSVVVAIRKGKKFVKEFKEIIRVYRKTHLLILFGGGALLVLSIFYWILWPLPFILVGGFYMLGFVKAVEESCFVKQIQIKKLVEGDWLAKDVLVEGKKVAGEGKSLEKKELYNLRSLVSLGKLKKVWVKEGFPFVPSFLLAYVLLIVSNYWSWF